MNLKTILFNKVYKFKDIKDLLAKANEKNLEMPLQELQPAALQRELLQKLYWQI